MKFTIKFEISPSWVFGLREPFRTVIPTGCKGAPLGAIVDLRTSKVIDKSQEYSQYRSEEEKISILLVLGEISGRIVDNIMYLDVNADRPVEASQKASQAVDDFLRHVAVNQQMLFQAKILQIEKDGQAVPVPGPITLGGLAIYNLKQLSRDIKYAEKYFVLCDDNLDKALKYFHYSLLLFEIALRQEFHSSWSSNFFISSAFLNLWKCITTIVGDPSRRKDVYQKSYAKIGLEKQQKGGIDQLKKLKDDYDVAHYSLQNETLSVVRNNFGKAIRIASEVIIKYREYIAQPTSSDMA